MGLLERANILYGLIKPNKRIPTAKRRRNESKERKLTWGLSSDDETAVRILQTPPAASAFSKKNATTRALFAPSGKSRKQSSRQILNPGALYTGRICPTSNAFARQREVAQTRQIDQVKQIGVFNPSNDRTVTHTAHANRIDNLRNMQRYQLEAREFPAHQHDKRPSILENRFIDLY